MSSTWDGMRVRKRDGRLDPLDQEKIVRSILRAGAVVGFAEDLLAEEMASLVVYFLEKDYAPGPVSAVEVKELIEKMLMETGHSEIARAYILHGERRERIKETLKIRESECGVILSPDGVESRNGQGSDSDGAIRSRPTGDIEVDGGDGYSVSDWSKGRIVEALVTEAEVPASVASEIAVQVEERVFNSGLTRISSSLIRELVDNELFNRGMNRRLLSQSLIGLPGFDVKRLVETDDGGRTPLDVDRKLAGAVLRQYALREIYCPEESEAHLRNDLRIYGLDRPTAFTAIDVEASLLPPPFGGPKVRPGALAAGIRFLCRLASGPVRVEVTDAVIMAHQERRSPGGWNGTGGKGVDPATFAEMLLEALADGPVAIESCNTVGTTTGYDSGTLYDPGRVPLIAVSRELTPARLRILSAAGMEKRAARHYLDQLVLTFLDSVSRLGLELAVPSLCVDLKGEVAPSDELIQKAVVLEASGRVRLSARGGGDEVLAPIIPQAGRVEMNLAFSLPDGQAPEGVDFATELRTQVALASAIFLSKDRCLTRLHRKGRGCKAAIRRFMGGRSLGGESDIVGPSTFQLVPSVILMPMDEGQLDFGWKGKATDSRPSFSACASLVRRALSEESRRSGHVIRMGAPWVRSRRDDVSPGRTGFGASTGYGFASSPTVHLVGPDASRRSTWAASTRWTLEASRYVELDPLPAVHRGEGTERMAYLKAVLEGLNERDHVS